MLVIVEPPRGQKPLGGGRQTGRLLSYGSHTLFLDGRGNVTGGRVTVALSFKATPPPPCIHAFFACME